MLRQCRKSHVPGTGVPSAHPGREASPVHNQWYRCRGSPALTAWRGEPVEMSRQTGNEGWPIELRDDPSTEDWPIELRDDPSTEGRPTELRDDPSTTQYKKGGKPQPSSGFPGNESSSGGQKEYLRPRTTFPAPCHASAVPQLSINITRSTRSMTSSPLKSTTGVIDTCQRSESP